MQDLLYNITSGTWASQLSFKSVAEAILSAAIIGFIISLVYILTHRKEGYSQAFCVSLILLAPIVALVILVIGNNVATAFSLAGAFALIRFRSAPGDPKDIAFLFMSVALGLTCGLGFWIYAAFAVLIFCLIILILHFSNYAGKNANLYELRITVPETLNYVGAFDDILEKYTKTYKLARIKSVDFGSLFELSFNVSLKNKADIREMLDELRAKNGNLKIMLSDDINLGRTFHY